MRDILCEHVPVVYEIGVGEDQTSLMVNVHKKAFEYASEILGRPNVPLASALRDEFRLPEFIPPSAENWGFGSVLSKADSDRSDWTVWRCALPARKKKHEIDWGTLYGISATLNVLTVALSIFEDEISAPKPQLLCIRLFTMRGDSGGSLSAEIGRAMLPWFSTQQDNFQHAGIQTIMKNTYERLTKYKVPNVSFGRFDAYFRQPYFVNLSCPGNACGLDPEDYFERKDRGYKLLPHNVDSPVQQLTLLMGLAAMHDEARKAGY